MSDFVIGVVIGFISCGCVIGIVCKIKEFVNNYVLFERLKCWYT